ncbi:hypothetical protein COC69_20385 [Bacillus cereus]|uniref:Uncharacterized protein n=1 Tax=Bacillus cereus TaxID=1396 RepID=A0A9X7CKW3_BACCE|nr:hypothetical protein [Bacillus cereus]PGS77368.1 hypothetical protein COC69_20385 [Bacillus cereus]
MRKKYLKKTMIISTMTLSMSLTGLSCSSSVFAAENNLTPIQSVQNKQNNEGNYFKERFFNNAFAKSIGPTSIENIQITEKVPRFVGSVISNNYTNEAFTDVTPEKSYKTVDSVTTSTTWEWNLENTIEVSGGVEVNVGFGKITGGVKESFKAGIKNTKNKTEFHSDEYTVTEKSRSIPLNPHQSKRLDTMLLTTKMNGTLSHTDELTGKNTFTIITDQAEKIQLKDVSAYELFKKLESLGDMNVNILPGSDIMCWGLNTKELRDAVIINDEKKNVYLKKETTTFTADLGSTQTISSLYDITDGGSKFLITF